MLYGFALNNEDGSTDYGVISAINPANAEEIIRQEAGEPVASVDIFTDAEAFIKECYRSSLAFCTTERC